MRGRRGVRATIPTSSQKKQNREPISQPAERWGRGVRRRNGPTGVYPSWWPGMGKETRAPARPLSSIQHDSTPGGVCASHGQRRRNSQFHQDRGGYAHVSVGGGEKGYQFGGREGARCGVTLWPEVGAEIGK